MISMTCGNEGDLSGDSSDVMEPLGGRATLLSAMVQEKDGSEW